MGSGFGFGLHKTIGPGSWPKYFTAIQSVPNSILVKFMI